MPYERQSSPTGRIFLRNDHAFLAEEKDTVEGKENSTSFGRLASTAINFSSAGSVSAPSPALSLDIARMATGSSLETSVKQKAHLPTGKKVLSNREVKKSRLSEPLFGTLRVLVADDNILVRTCLLALLERWKVTFTICDNGRTAWEALQEDKYDLVLIDLQMPFMDGHEVVERLRSSTNNQNRLIPVVAMTASTEVQDYHQIMEAGANDYLNKPLQAEELFRTITRQVKLPEYVQTQLFTDYLDYQALFDLYGDDYQHLDLMLDIFLKNTPIFLQKMEEAIKKGDRQNLQKALHKVRPTFAMVGLQRISELVGSLEMRVGEKNKRSFSDELAADFKQLRDTIQEALSIVRLQKKSISDYLK